MNGASVSHLTAALTATLILGSGAAAVVAQSPRTLQRNAAAASEALNLADSHFPQLGEASAPVLIVEFSEFGCPYCRKHAGTVLPQIVDKYVNKGEVRYLFVQMPPEGEATSEAKAIALLCAAHEGALLPTYQSLFSANEAPSGLSTESFATCQSGPEIRDELAQHIAFAKQSGVVGTPTFLVGRMKGDRFVDVKKVFGVQPMSFFDTTVDRLLAARR